MKNKNRVALVVISICMFIAIVASTMLIAGASAAKVSGAIDAMEAILADETLSSYKKGETVKLEKDGYIGIPVEISVYYSGENDDIILGKALEATPIVIYVVNANIERIGTDSDVDIISSMLDRGYIVVIFDYLNNAKAQSPALDWSVQSVRAKVTDGTYMAKAGLPSGAYKNNMVVPAGYDIEFSNVYWEIDKHSADGTLERIVTVWNNDFRAKKKNTVIKWVDYNGNRKATQTGIDGTDPVWLDANGNVDANGEYIKISYTKAEKIEDCVKADGTPIDLNLYMHVIYPTNPENEVPVMVLSGSSEHLAGGTQKTDRPQLNGFLFNGYAAAAFDHGYVPMTRDDHYGYFDGDDADSISGDNATYSIHNFNNTRIDTAAMRYIRYLSASDHDKYAFNNDAIGVYGNSKGGWATMLGEENPDINAVRRVLEGYNGKTRYENGKTEDIVFGNGYVIEGGTEQPWLTYNGEALKNGADLTYMSCGWGAYNITSSHSPTFISCNLGDGSYYSTSNQYVNACRNADVVALWFEVNQGHTFASDTDMNYGVNTYQALFDFVGYHLKGDGVQVVYVSRAADSYSGMPSNAPIVVKFTGSVSIDEVSKITLVSSAGEVVEGTWTSQFGETEWTLQTPTLDGNETYVLNVPAGIKGDNGKEMTDAYTYEFRTGYEKANGINAITTDNGTYLYFTMPDASLVEEFKVDLYKLRLYVSDDAVNKLQVYALSGFSVNAPDSATVGKLVDTVAVAGAGQYDVDVTSLLAGARKGSIVAFLVKQVNSAGEVLTHSSPLADNLGSCTKGGKVNTTLTTAPDGTKAWKIYKFNPQTSYVNDRFYQNYATLFTNSAIIKSGNLVEEDIGRTFKISFKVYDTTSRIISVQMLNLSSSADSFADYNVSYYDVYTKANEWVEVSFEHTVYEPLYAEKVGYKTQKLTVMTSLEGSQINPMYFSDVKSVEIFTDVEVAKAELLLGTTEQVKNPLVTKYGVISDKYASATDYPFVIFDEKGNCLGAHKNFLDTASSYDNAGSVHIAKTYLAKTNYWDGEGYGDSPAEAFIVMRADYTMTTEEQYNNLAQVQGLLTIDLNGYTLTAATDRTIFPATIKQWSGSGDADYFHDTEFKFINGEIVTYNQPVVLYSCTATEYKKLDITFESVDFKALGSASDFLVDYNDKSTQKGYPNVTFTDCSFDISESSASEVNLFKLGNAYIKANITVNGCTVNAGDTEMNMFLENASGGAVTFAEGSNGSYLEVEVAGAKIPTGAFNGGSLTFVKAYEYENTTVYALVPTEITTYLPKMSITLYTQLTMNVYVPVANTVAFALDGNSYKDMEALANKVVNVNGEDYYVVSVKLDSAEAARNVTLNTTISMGGKNSIGTFTFSIPKYTTKVLDNVNASETEKTLAKDVLAYVKAAYNYFADYNTEEEIARVNALVDSIIGADYTSVPVSSGATNTIAPVTSVTLVLEAKPAIRFYVTDTNVKFYANGKKLNTVSGEDENGAYVEIGVYAYALCETITYGNGGSYHVSSFVEGAVETDYEALVKAFVKYTESAKKYRDEAIGN